MFLSPSSIANLANIITGNSGIPPERNFAEICILFKKYIVCESLEVFKNNNNLQGLDDNEILLKYTISKLNSINATSKLTKLVEYIANNSSFYKDAQDATLIFDQVEVIASINAVIKHDNYEIFKARTKNRVYGLNDSLVDYQCLFCKNKLGAYTVIKDHLDKCYLKVNNGDYTGAITNARTLEEQILREIEIHLDSNATSYDGKLPNLYKRVMSLLNFEEGMSENIKTIYRQILGGLSGSINGFAGLRNTMSDSHPIEHMPTENDAILAVNEAKTIANFVVKYYFEKFVNAA